ncbi:UPF0149 family protein [Taklimakanibacter deserti]|uniref:UPF0149 family protein n=1 Tax=Taklimakanibacter deserti TaxID=2267839 RepID=UPI000E653CDD
MVKSKLDQLQDFLLGLPDENDEWMLVEELDGFLAGVLVCPELILFSGWMPYIWSKRGSDDQAPVFKDLAEAQYVFDLIKDHYNSIALSLLPNSKPYEPVFAVYNRTGEVLWEIWVEGFERAMALSPTSWLAIVESGDKDAIDALAGLRSLIAIAGGKSTLPKPEQDRLIAGAPDLIPEWVETKPHRSSAGESSFKNIGRNDPCPCGSGRKYKKCHGAN